VVRRVSDPREAAAAKARLRLLSGHSASGAPPILELEGEYDLDTVPEIDRFLRRNLGPLYHQNHLVIDLTMTTFIDSSFVAFLLRLSGAQRSKRRELVLARPSGQVRRVLGLVGLPNVVPVFDTVDAAVDSVVHGPLPVIPPAFSAVGS